MDNLNAGVAGKSGPVEGENGGEAMHMHGGDQPGIVRGLPGNAVLIYQALPYRMNSRGIGQQEKHILQSHQFGRRLRGSQPQTVLGNRPRGHHPQLDQVLRNDVKLAALRGQSFDRNASRFALRMQWLAGSEAMCWYR